MSGHVKQGRGSAVAPAKDLDRRYMQAWLAKTPQPAPQVIGVDELPIKKGHPYRIVVSDLERGRPIWVGGQGQTEADLDRFYLDLGSKKTARIQLAMMDMWKAFRNSVQAQILFDKFHILRHLADAMDQVRRAEYKRVALKDRACIKGQRDTLLSHRANLTLAGRRSLRKLLRANKRLATAYLLKEEFGQLWPIAGKAGRASSSPAGKNSSSGNGSGPSRSLPP